MEVFSSLGVFLPFLNTATQCNVHEPYGGSLPSFLPFLLSYIVFCSQPLGTFSFSPLGSRQPLRMRRWGGRGGGMPVEGPADLGETIQSLAGEGGGGNGGGGVITSETLHISAWRLSTPLSLSSTFTD